MFKLPHKLAHDAVSLRSAAHLPIGNDPAVALEDWSFQNFGFPGTASAPGHFVDGWRVRVPESGMRQLIAAFTGSLRLVASTAAGGNPSLRLTFLDPVLASGFKHLRPEWLSPPEVVTYANVDRANLLTDLAALEGEDFNLTWSIREKLGNEGHFNIGTPWPEVVDQFLLDPEKNFEFPIRSGTRIGKMAASAAEPLRFETTIRFTDPTGTLAFNPSWYVDRFQRLFAGLGEHKFMADLLVARWGPVTNGVFRYVRKGGTGTADFLTPATASATVTAAVAAAGDHDTIVILDNGVYKESELVLKRPLTITGFAQDSVRADGFEAGSTALPKIDGSGAHRCFFVHSLPARPAAPLCLRNLVIQNGLVQDKPDATNYRGGGGVAVEKVDAVVIENCAFVANKTLWRMDTLNMYAQLPKAARDLLDNPPDFFKEKAAELKTRLQAVKNFGLAGQAFGGGVSLLESSAYALRNLFKNNTAMARGGAVGVAGYGWPVIEGNAMRDNRATHGGGEGRPDGGAVGVTIAIPSQKLSLTIKDMMDDLLAWLGTRTADQLGGLLLDYVTDDLAIVRGFLDDSRIRSYWSAQRLASAKDRAVILRDNAITGNVADDDGGGVYLSVMSGAHLAGNGVRENTTVTGSGGGVRLTMASHMTITDDKVERNTAYTAAGTNEDGNGGGGIAARDAELVLTGGAALRDTNRARGWAGGGIFFSSSSEGGTLLLFHVILWDAFKFRKSILRLDSGASVTDNETLDIPGGGHHSKGGGVYVLRSDVHDDIPDLDVRVARDRISANRAKLVGGSPANEGKTDFNLVDQIGDEEHGDAEYAEGTGDYVYTS